MRLRSCIAATLLLAAGSPALAAQGPEAMPPEPFAEAVVELHVNDQPAPTTLVVRRDVDGTLLLRADDLEALRLKTPPRGALLVNGERYYRLGPRWAPSWRFDDATMTATGDAAGASLPADAARQRRRRTLRAPRAPRRARS